MLSEALLCKNLFRSVARTQSRRNILTMPIPQFSSFRSDVKLALEAILPRCFQRDRDKRHQSSLDMLTDLEIHLYGADHRPINERLGVHLKELFDVHDLIIPALPTRHPM